MKPPSLLTGTEMVLEMLVVFNEQTWLIALEDVINRLHVTYRIAVAVSYQALQLFTANTMCTFIQVVCLPCQP